MRRYIIGTGLAGVLLLLGGQASRAAVPNQLAWQGVALDSTNIPLADGHYTFHFAIYSDDVGGDSLWGESQSVQVENGVLNVLMGRNTPIADSVFSGPARFLQVQFEDQVPYLPRTRIVSVGYAYRTNSIDGAQAGLITGDLTVTGGVEADGITVPGTALPGAQAVEAALPAVQAQSGAEGGQVDIYDESGAPVLMLGGDPDGAGGQLSVASDPLFERGIILDGDANGSGEPRFAIIGTSGALELDMSSGDVSLVLPPGAINADVIADEPGVATGVQDGAINDIRDDFVGLATATATFPAEGYALIVAEGTFRNHFPFSWLDGRLIENGAVAAEFYWDPGDADFFFDQRQSYLQVTAVSAGTHTYELHVRQTIGRSDAVDGKLTVLYFPTSYGSIVAQADIGAGGPADTVQTEPRVGSGINPVAERADAVQANQARIEQEVAAMEARVQVLKQELARTRLLMEQEP